ncbi:MAG TPA: YfiR family protein [Chryseosolibacter sp.]|nr:YfiR family protein [Chryseosolibacter sp.]
MRKSILLVILSLSLVSGYAQNYNLHTVFIYSFTRYVIWPEDYNKGDFEILVLGDTPMYETLVEMAKKKKVGERTIKVTKISNPSEIRKSNIVFVPSDKSASLGDVISKVSNQSILIITEEPGLGSKGSDINFIMKEGKLAFELNQSAVARQNLKIANELSRLAILI